MHQTEEKEREGGNKTKGGQASKRKRAVVVAQRSEVRVQSSAYCTYC